MVSPILDEIAAEHADKHTVAKLNVDEKPTTVARCNIKAIPTIAVFHNGSLAKTIVGAQPKAEKERQLAGYISGSYTRHRRQDNDPVDQFPGLRAHFLACGRAPKTWRVC